MYIKSMVIDGFKSYGQRTEINGFDPLFNAITGLNGSGKSNILDAICFLLGITNLSQVRATNLQELVYKNGQAGVTKATVSVVFDNTNKQQSPLGYEQYDEITVTRQVVMGGRNKYLINGCNANNTRVQDLFRSVQLNVNNPHFLIMQGRITKVLNMKPPEVLSMIEEAAGTRMYESKKLSAQRVIEKKDSKLKEIESVLAEDITPTLTRLKAERQNYMEYTKVSREVDHLSKLYVAWQFTQAEELCQKSTDTLQSIKDSIQDHRQHVAELERQANDIEKEIHRVEQIRDQEGGSRLLQLEEQLKEKQMEEAKATSVLQHTKDNLKEEAKKTKELQKHFNEDQAAVLAKEKELNKLASSLEKLQEASRRDAEALAAAQKRFQAISAGLSSNDQGEQASLADQLMSAKSEISQAETETKQAEMKLAHAQSELTSKRTECQKTEKSYQHDQQLCAKLEGELQMLQNELDRLQYEEGKEESLLAEQRRLSREIETLQDKIDVSESRFPNLSFEYKDPERNFDRRSVRGLVCHLIQMNDPSTATALEVAAGGRLHSVVVDNEITGKKLLERGQLKRRFTIIPLNKIVGRSCENSVLRRAEELVGRGNVCTALSLINYDPCDEPAMKYVFGDTLVCPDMETAKRVAFGEGVSKRTVTLDGEVFDPAGTLTGGAISRGSSVLLHLSQMESLHSEMDSKQQTLRQINEELRTLTVVSGRYRELKHQHDLKTREVELSRARLQQTTHHKQLEDVRELERSIEEQRAMLIQCQDIKKKAEERARDLQYKIKNAKSIRERELKDTEAELNACKRQAENSGKLSKEQEQEAVSLKLEAEELQKGLASYQEQLQAAEEATKNYEQELESQTHLLQDLKAATLAVLEEVKAQKLQLKAQSEEIGRLHKQKNTLSKEGEERKLQIQQLEHDASRTKQEAKNAADKVQSILSKYDWIEQERQYFGVPNTEYDFSTNNPVEAGRRIQKLQETKDKLAKSVNMRAQNMMSKAEEQYQDLLRKKKVVENDRAKIAAVIKELDEKKLQALKEAWEKVNVDFGSIFSMLLPGTNAKLVPPDGQTVLEGLEIKVAFGDIWKESLSELSGGQRSLVALSLILSFLLFKPAPIYILDEVDAALDLSHTQNIGQMLRAHFKHSQFIVVSLKDGMFNNANVLFKTRFLDGMSSVTRTSQHQGPLSRHH